MEALATSSFPVSSRRKNMFPYFNAIRESPTVADLNGVVAYHNAAPVAIILGSAIDNEGADFNFCGAPARLEVASEDQNFPAASVLKRLAKELIGFIEGRGALLELKPRNSSENAMLYSLLAKANSHKTTFEAISKPALGAEAIMMSIRSSHRQSIKKGLQNFHQNIEVHHGNLTPDVGESFMRLHAHAAGRVTRPESTWEEMFLAVRAKKALLVTAKFEGELVGATYSWLGPNDALYGTGAYKRELFSVFPISHALLFRSLEIVGELGLNEFVLGDPFAIAGSEKEKGIASFKMGFAQEIHLVHQISLA